MGAFQIVAAEKSCKDKTRLTVDFNLRTRDTTQVVQSPARDDTLRLIIVSSLQDFVVYVYLSFSVD